MMASYLHCIMYVASSYVQIDHYFLALPNVWWSFVSLDAEAADGLCVCLGKGRKYVRKIE